MTHREKTRRRIISSLLASIFLILNLSHPTRSQNVGSVERWDARAVLKQIKEGLKRNFYDPNFRGVDIEARFKEAEAKIEEAQSQAQLYGIIEQFLLYLNDPNTFFAPPIAYSIIDYGWNWLMVGDRCYVTA